MSKHKQPWVRPGDPERFVSELDELVERLLAGEEDREVVRGLARIATSYELALAHTVREFLQRTASGDVAQAAEHARYLTSVEVASANAKRAVGLLQSAYDRGNKAEWDQVAAQAFGAVRALVDRAAARVEPGAES